MLKAINKHYEVAIFTASLKTYADPIIDYLDPNGIFFQHRLYRENCIKTKEGYYIKDLRIINNIDIKNMVLVDNSV